MKDQDSLSPDVPLTALPLEDPPATWTLDLAADDYVEVVAEQKGLDIELAMLSPEGEVLHRTDRPTYAAGREVMRFIAPTAGPHRLEVRLLVRAVDDDGVFDLAVTARRPATAEDRKRVEADRLSGAQALAKLRRALAGWQELGEADEVATTQLRIGNLLLRGGEDPDEARELLQAALEHFEATGNAVEAGGAASLLASLTPRSEQGDRYLQWLRRAAGHVESLGPWADPGTAGATYLLLANRELWLDHLEEATRAYERALELAGDEGETRGWALLGLGRVRLARREVREARWFFEAARRLASRIGKDYFEARLDGELCEILRLEKASGKARRCLEGLLEKTAGQTGSGGNWTRFRLRLLGSLGALYLEEEDLPAARRRFEEALEMAAGDRSYRAYCLHHLGLVAQAEGDLASALDLQRRARSLHEAAGEEQGVLTTGYAEGRVLYLQGELESAWDVLNKTRARAEGQRARSQSLDSRSAYVAARRHYWELEVDVAVALHRQHPGQGWDLRAFDAAERARARSFTDALEEARAGVRRDAPAELLEKEARLLREMQVVETAEVTASPAQVEDRRIRLSLQLDRIRRELRSATPADDLETPDPPSLAQFEASLMNPGAVLVAYFVGEENAYVFVQPQGGELTTVSLGPTPELDRVVREFLETVTLTHASQASRRRAAARELSDRILDPIREILSRDRRPWLILVPDGPLSRVPFAALPWPETAHEETPIHLVQTHEITIAPSLAALRTIRRNALQGRPASDPTLVLFADPAGPPVTEGGLPPLPGSATEAETIARLVARDVTSSLRLESLTGAAATVARVHSGTTARARILHIAAHGFADAAHPESSQLVLATRDADGRPLRGRLTAGEISTLDLRAELVVLSACETGAGPLVRGEGVQSLARAFLHAGTQRVVYTLWPVSDESSARFFGHFYEAYLTYPRSASKALRAAQMALMEDPAHAHPSYWAAYAVQGEWWVEMKEPDIGQAIGPDPEPPEEPNEGDLPGKPPTRRVTEGAPR